MTSIRKTMMALAVACGLVTAHAATPVATWTDFNNLTSGDYTWVNAGGTVNEDGSFTVGEGGLTMTLPECDIATNRLFTIVLDAEVPVFASEQTIFDLVIEGTQTNHVSGTSKETTYYQRWNGAGDYGSKAWNPTMRRKIGIAFRGAASGDDRGTYTHFDGAVKVFKQSLMSSSGSVTQLSVGCYGGETKVATGMRIYGIELYDTNMTLYSPCLACNYDGAITGSGTTRPGISENTGYYNDSSRGQACEIMSGQSTTQGTKWSYGADGWTVTTVAKLASSSYKTALWMTGAKSTGFAGLFSDTKNSKMIFGYGKDSSFTEICSLSLPTDSLTAYHVYTVSFDKATGTIRLVCDKDFTGAATGTYTEALPTGTGGQWKIGTIRGGNPSGFAVANYTMMDDFRLYQYTFSDDEVSTFVDELLPPIPTGLTGTKLSASAINEYFGTQAGVALRLTPGTTITMDEPLAVNELRISCDGDLTIEPAGDFKVSEEEQAKYTFGYVAGFLNRSWARPAGEVISINFDSDSGAVLDGSDHALAGDVPGTSWLGSEHATETAFAVTKAWDGANNREATVTGMTAAWTCSGTYTENSSTYKSIVAPFMNGYLDDSATVGPTINLTGIPYDRYDVIIYRALRGTDAFTPYTVTHENGVSVSYTCGADGVAVVGTENWGKGRQAKDPTWGINAMVIKDLTDANITLSTVRQTGGRCGTAAIQIVENLSRDYTATIGEAGTFDLSELDWSPKPFAPKGESMATITVDPSVSGEVAINCDVNDMTLTNLTVVSSADVRLTKSEEIVTTVGTYDFTRTSGKVTLGFDFGKDIVLAGGDTVLETVGTGDLVIGEGKKITVTGSGLKASQVTNNGTLSFQGGTEEEPISVTGDANLGVVTLGEDTYVVHDDKSALRKYTVTGSGLSSVYRITRGTVGNAGMASGSAFTNLVIESVGVGSGTGDSLWIEKAVIDATVGLKATGGTILNSPTPSPVVVASLSGAGAVSSYKTDKGLTIRSLEDADYAGASAATITVEKGADDVAQTFSGNYTGSLTVGLGAKVVLSSTDEAAAKPSKLTVEEGGVVDVMGLASPVAIENHGTINFSRDDYYILPNDNEGTINVVNGDLIVMVGTERGTINVEDGAVYDGFTVTINDCGVFKVPDGYDPEKVRLVYPGGALANIEEYGEDYVYFTWDITDGACWWDYEFDVEEQNAPVTSTGADKTTMTAEGTKPYYNEDLTALWVGHATHYRSATYPEEFTAVMYGKIVDQEKQLEIGFGSTYNSDISVALGCGDSSAEEVLLIISQGKTVLKTVSMSVPNAYTADHLYAFVCQTIGEGEDQKTKVTVYLDGIAWDSYTFDKKITLGSGFQIGSVYGGAPEKPTKYTKASKANENSFLEFLRTYNVALNAEAMTRYAKEYPYESANGEATRMFEAGEATWVADGAWEQTYEGDTYTTNCPLPTTMIEVTALGDAVVTMDLATNATYESFTASGDGSFTFQTGDGATMPTVSGLTTVGTDVTAAYDAIKFGKTTVLAGKTLTFDFTGFPLEQVWSDTSYEVTGAVTLGEDAAVEAANIPEAVGRTVVFGLNEFDHYALNITVAKDFTMTVEGGTTTWTVGDEEIDEPDWAQVTTANITKKGAGAGSFIGKNGYTYTIDAGILQFTNNVNMVTSTITVNAGGTFDMHGNDTGSHYDIVLNGGTLANYGALLGFTKRQLRSITLTDDSFVTTSNNLCFVSNSYQANTLDLGGHTLTKNGEEAFILMNTVVTNGVVVVEDGELRVNAPTSTENYSVFTDDATLEVQKGAILHVGRSSLVLPEITGEGSITLDTALTVSNRLEGALAITGNGTLTLAEGAVLDLAMLEGTYTWATQFACTETQAINLNGRESLKLGDKIIAWTAIPEDVTFVWDEETAKAGVEPEETADGLYYGFDPESKVVDKAYWTGAASGDAMNPANWACTNMAGYVVAEAIPTNAEATVHLTAPLAHDCDWTGLGAFAFAQDTLVDLDGHNLAVADFANRTTGVVVTNSNDEVTGDFIVDIAAEKEVGNASVLVTGNTRLVKEGAGMYYTSVQQQLYTGGTVISNGVVKATSYEKFHCLGAAGADITVEPNGTLDNNGQYDWVTHRIILNGGTLQNTGSSMTQTSWGAFGDVVLTADSKMKLKYHVIFNNNDATSYVDLGGHTLTAEFIDNPKDPKAIVYAVRTNWKNGTFEMGTNIVLRPYSTSTFADDVTIVCNGDLQIFNGDKTFGSLVDNSEGTHDTYGNVITIRGTYKPLSPYLHSTVMADGSTLDLTEQTGPWTFTCKDGQSETFTFAEGAAITVDVTGRTLSAGAKLVAWTEPPTDVTFTAKGTELALESRADGLYAGGVGFMMFVAYGVSDEFAYAAPDTFANAQWVEGATNRVIEAVKATQTNATLDVEFVLTVNDLYGKPDVIPDASGALVPATTGFYGWGAGAWYELPYADVAAGEINCRIELKTIGGAPYVRYLVKGDGEAWTVLKSKTGREWFETTCDAETTTQAGITDEATITSITATCEPEEAPSATFYWIGKSDGAWGDTNNWSLAQGGTPAKRVPGQAGDLALVSGDITIDGVATRDLVVAYGEGDEGTAIGGSITGGVVLDTSRPLAGQTLTASVKGLFGRTGFNGFSWERASWAKDYAACAEGAAITLPTDDYEHWYRLTAKAEGQDADYTKEFYFSKLSVIYLTTDDGEAPSTKKEEHAGTIICQGGKDYKAIQFDKKEVGTMTVKLRGNSTLSYPKKAYKVKLDKKTDMFGMGKQKHWVMLANYNDPANQRNKLAYDLANDIGSLGMDSTWVVCVFNGEYKGLYQFGEHIRIDGNRVNIRDWESIAEDEGGKAEDLSVIDPEKYDIAGSYLMEFSSEGDEVTTWYAKSGYLDMVSMANKPEYLNTNPAMYNFVTNFMQEYWDACTSADRKNPTTGKSFMDYSDLDSMALFTIVNEIFTNHDACKKSRYAYIDDPVSEGGTGKLIWGPVWDFDWGSGSKVVGTANTNCWTTCGQSINEASGQKAAAKKYSMFKEWFSDSDFCRRIHALYWKHRARFEEMVKADGLIDQNKAYLAEAAKADDAKWTGRRTSAEDTEIMRDNLVKHLAWLDEQFKTPKTLHDSVEAFAKDIQSAPQDYKPLGTLLLLR